MGKLEREREGKLGFCGELGFLILRNLKEDLMGVCLYSVKCLEFVFGKEEGKVEINPRFPTGKGTALSVTFPCGFFFLSILSFSDTFSGRNAWQKFLELNFILFFIVGCHVT